jgi:hypothetical protein
VTGSAWNPRSHRSINAGAQCRCGLRLLPLASNTEKGRTHEEFGMKVSVSKGTQS